MTPWGRIMDGPTLAECNRSILMAENDYLRALPTRFAARLVDDLRLVEFRRGREFTSAELDSLIIFPLTAVFLFELDPADGQPSFSWIASSHNTLFGRRGDWEESAPYNLHTLEPGFALVIDKEACVRKLGTSDWARFHSFFGGGWVLRIFGMHVTCLATHAVPERLASALLEAAHAFGPDRGITMTHAQLGRFLAVRRESVTLALSALVEQQLITLGHGRITVADADALHKRACACHAPNGRTWRDLLDGWRGVWADAERREEGATPDAADG